MRLLANILIREDTGLQIQVVEIFRVALDFFKNTDNFDENAVELLLGEMIAPCVEHYAKLTITN